MLKPVQTGRRRLGDETEKDAAGIFNSFAKFGFPVLAWLDLLLVKPDKEPFVLKLFDYEFGNLQIRRSVTDEDTSGSAMSEAMGLFHKSGVVGGFGDGQHATALPVRL